MTTLNKFCDDAHVVILNKFRFKLVTPLRYQYGTEVITVPAGFVTDLASFPRILWSLWPPHGQYARAAIVHDYLYQYAIQSKQYADTMFLNALAALEVSKWERSLFYWSVKLFGTGNYKKEI